MRVNTIAQDLRDAANTPATAGPLLAKAAVEIEFLRGGYSRILCLSADAVMRGEAQKIAREYVSP